MERRNDRVLLNEKPTGSVNKLSFNERKAYLEERLKESGEQARLENYLRQKLIECGWKEELKNHCKEIIRSKGIEKVTIEDLVEEISVRAKNAIPIKLKEDVLAKIKVYFEDEALI